MAEPSRAALMRWGLAGVATLLAVGAGLLGATGSAAVEVESDEACWDSSTAITVVVDARNREGDSVARCVDLGGDAIAQELFAEAGFELRHASQHPGFICRIDGVPESEPCTRAAPADAFWALSWAGPGDDSWIRASRGVTQLRVPAGGFVAFSWVEEPVEPPGGETGSERSPPVSDEATTDDAAGGGFPWWIIAALVAVGLLGSAIATTLRRRQAP